MRFVDTIPGSHDNFAKRCWMCGGYRDWDGGCPACRPLLRDESNFVIPKGVKNTSYGDLGAQLYLAHKLERGEISEDEWQRGMDQIMDDMREHDKEVEQNFQKRLEREAKEKRVTDRILSYTPSK